MFSNNSFHSWLIKSRSPTLSELETYLDIESGIKANLLYLTCGVEAFVSFENGGE